MGYTFHFSVIQNDKGLFAYFWARFIGFSAAAAAEEITMEYLLPP